MKPHTLSVLLAGLLFAGGVHATSAEHIRASHAWIRVLPGNLPAGAYVNYSSWASHHLPDVWAVPRIHRAAYPTQKPVKVLSWPT